MRVKVPFAVGPFADHHLDTATTVDVAPDTVDPVRSGVAG
jgi:hypothetical protein